MSKVAVVYWSGTGNTEKMAEMVAEGVKKAGADADLFPISEFDASKLNEYDAFAFGCPSMGSEQLEDTEFEPVWESVKSDLSGKKLGLFGSYGWGSGEWMENWESDCSDLSCTVVGTVICMAEPGDEAQAECFSLGEKLV